MMLKGPFGKWDIMIVATSGHARAAKMSTAPPLGLGAREAEPYRGHGDQRGQRGLILMTLFLMDGSIAGTGSGAAGQGEDLAGDDAGNDSRSCRRSRIRNADGLSA